MSLEYSKPRWVGFAVLFLLSMCFIAPAMMTSNCADVQVENDTYDRQVFDVYKKLHPAVQLSYEEYVIAKRHKLLPQ